MNEETVEVPKNGVAANIAEITHGVDGLRKKAVKWGKIWMSVGAILTGLGAYDRGANHMRMFKWLAGDAWPTVDNAAPERTKKIDQVLTYVSKIDTNVDSITSRDKRVDDMFLSTATGKTMIKQYKEILKERAEYDGVVSKR